MALPQGALFWPARRALLVADLHLEKASWFARLGQMLPPYDSIATLADLSALAASTGAEEIWCLGDSFHDASGCDRLPARGAGAADRAHRRDALDLDHRQSRSRLRRSLRRRDRRGGRGGRPDPPPRGRSRPRRGRSFSGHFHPKLQDHPSRPPGLAPLLRRDRDQADPPRLRIADRRARRPSSRDRPRGRHRRAGLGAGRRTAC